MSLREQLIAEEGWIPHVYADSAGWLTVGVGHLVDPRKGGRLRDVEIGFILDNDIEEKRRAVLTALPWAASLDEPRQAVLIGMAFQMGVKGLLAFRNTLAHVKAGRYADAARGMLASRWAQQTPQRAHRMAEQMRTGAWQAGP